MADQLRRRPVVQGHRGYRAAWPENTVPGFLAALRGGADAIELDAGLTSDGVVVVCHDAALDPDLTRDADGRWIDAPGPVIVHHTLAELARFDVGRARPGGATATAFPRQLALDGTRLPSLAEVFAATAFHRGRVDVELKTDPGAGEHTPDPVRLVEAVLAVAEAADARRRLALRSFDWRGLDHAARIAPDIALTWLSDDATDAAPGWRGGRAGPVPDSLAGLAGATWAPDHRGLRREQVRQAQDMGLRVVPWTVNEPSDLIRLLEWGVDGVCTDDVAMAVRLVSERRGSWS